MNGLFIFVVLKRPQAETAVELDALLPAIRAFKGELDAFSAAGYIRDHEDGL